MADPITPDVSQRICKHMNDDHRDALVLYAKVFGGVAAAAAEMATIDSQGMDLLVEVDGNIQSVRIAFDHELTDSEDAHHTLIAMVKQARSAS